MKSLSSPDVPSLRDMIELNVTHKGEVFQLKTKCNISLTVESIIAIAIQNFYSAAEKPDQFKLVSVSGRYALQNDRFVMQTNLKNNDELILVRRRTAPAKENLPEEKLGGPTVDQILEATINIERKNANRQMPLGCSSDFKTEMRKIFMSLAEATALVLSTNPKSDEIVSMLRVQLEAEPNSHAVRQLMSIGFTETAVRHALKRNRLNKEEALEWLLDGNNADFSGSDDEQPGESNTLPGNSKSGSKSCKKKPYGKVNLVQYVASLLEKYRRFKQRDFRPNARVLQSLIEMGFEDEEAVKEALKITGNDHASACEWLMGERRPSLQDMDVGLDVQGTIYKAILKCPEVQLSMNNPRMLLSFLNMIESPSTISRWLADSETGPVIHQICRIYHAEKHAP